ncbi:MAG: SprT family zinc-dependent metalloprotease [Erysipelotrichaceae bacterium]
MENHCISVGSFDVHYILLRKQVKNINLRINSSGEICVSANKFVPIDKIDKFVGSKVEWILERRRQINKRMEISKPDFVKRQITIFGYDLKIKISIQKYNRVTYDNEYLYVYLKSKDDLEKVIKKFLKQLCRDVYDDICKITYNTMLKDYQIEYPNIKIREMTSRWGSCMPNKNQITLNSKLIHYPIEFIEYVILHEFVHFIQPNHSKQFYSIIEKYMPNYKNVLNEVQA